MMIIRSILKAASFFEKFDVFEQEMVKVALIGFLVMHPQRKLTTIFCDFFQFVIVVAGPFKFFLEVR
jgi:hypothetical protein